MYFWGFSRCKGKHCFSKYLTNIIKLTFEFRAIFRFFHCLYYVTIVVCAWFSSLFLLVVPCDHNLVIFCLSYFWACMSILFGMSVSLNFDCLGILNSLNNAQSNLKSHQNWTLSLFNFMFCNTYLKVVTCKQKLS